MPILHIFGSIGMGLLYTVVVVGTVVMFVVEIVSGPSEDKNPPTTCGSY